MNRTRKPEVWVTGIGAATPLGWANEATLDALLAGETGVHPDPAFDGRAIGRCDGLVPDRRTRRLDRSGRLFFAAAEDAWVDAGLSLPTDPAGDSAAGATLFEGSSLGPMAELLTRRPATPAEDAGAPRPSDLVRFMSGAGGAAFALAYGLRGPVLHVSAGSVSAAAAIGEGFLRIVHGEADLVLAGGAECPLEKTIVSTFDAAGVLAPAGDDCRPFDRERTGTVLAEGAGVLVLESADHAQRRGARPWAALTGYGFATAGSSMTAPDPNGREIRDAVVRAMEDARPARPLAWIKAHGTGTSLSDAAECRGLAAALGAVFASTPLVSLKPALGHTLGASGAVEAALALLALARGIIPGVATLCRPDPNLPHCRPLPTATPQHEGPVLLLSESFGGRCVALLAHRLTERRPARRQRCAGAVD